MRSFESNKNNPKFREYYQSLADIIGIFWQFHKERVQSGNIEFAYKGECDYIGYKHTLFNPQAEATKSPPARQEYLWGLFHKRTPTYNVVDSFGTETASTLTGSWIQFLEGVGAIDHLPNFLEGMPEPPESTQRFMDPYVNSLITKAEDLGKNVSTVELTNQKYSIGAVVT